MPDHAELIRLPFPDDDSLGYGATPDISRDREGCASILPVPKHQHWHLWLLIPASIACVILFAVGQCGREWGIEFILGSGESRRSSTLKSFNLFDSIKALQDEDRLSLAILLWITSVIWPYMKIVLNLCIFFVTIKAPSAIKGLSWVEALGKWNHVDVIVCYLMVLVIRIKIEQEKVQEVLQSIEPSTLTPDGQAFYHYLEDSLLSVLPFPIELQVNGKQGLYLYCTAVCFSMLSGHMTEWMIWSRKSRSKDPLMSMIGDTPRYRRNSDLSVFQDVDDKGTHPSDVRIALNQLVNQQWKRWSVVLLMVSNVILFVCATNISFIYAKFTFPFVNQKDKHWTVFEGLCDVFGMHRSSESDVAGTRFVAAMLLTFAVIAPAIRLAMQLAVWIMPTTPRTLRTLMIVQEVANMWSGLDVLLLAVGITSAEMGSLTAGLGRQAIKYLIGHKAYDEYKLKTLCDGCIKFDLKMDDGYYIMIVHCALSLLINYAIHHVYYSAFDDEGQPLAGTSYTIGDYDSDDVDGLNVDNHKKGKDLFISAKGQIL